MTQTIEEVLRVAKYDCHVLITGDTGVGKEKIANMIQKNSTRKLQPYLKVNCASISLNLMESEFFGYEKGSFTGANQSGKKGYFEIADNGILFLDEIGEIPSDLQAKLLRVLQDGEFYRVGGTRPIRTNVRILSATNKDLEALVEKGLFRRDLYYRLNVFPVRVPKLEERRDDIPALITYFLEIYGEKFGILREMQEDVMAHLSNMEWPGNIRELENLIQRLMITTSEERITLMDLMKELHKDIFQGDTQQSGGSILQLNDAIEHLEKTLLENAKVTYGSTRKAAAALGISQTQFVRKTKKYELD
jgi:transcriptional regulator with PAS, ATPase and Fis domain